MLVTKTSLLTGVEHTREIDVDPETLLEWLNRSSGELRMVQDFFPHLSADDREFLLSGATPEEWDKFFPAEKEA